MVLARGPPPTPPPPFDLRKNKLRKGPVLSHACSPLCYAFKPNAIVPFFPPFLRLLFDPFALDVALSLFLSRCDAVAAVKRRNNDKSVPWRKKKNFSSLLDLGSAVVSRREAGA